MQDYDRTNFGNNENRQAKIELAEMVKLNEAEKKVGKLKADNADKYT